jgi:hypothetical protein
VRRGGKKLAGTRPKQIGIASDGFLYEEEGQIAVLGKSTKVHV